jgi:tagatose 6-phosphate kinase
MILSVTMNPSVDISYHLPKLTIDTVMRCQKYSKTAGGKGLNVARVLHQMEQPVTCTGVLGGELGDFIRHQLTQEAIDHQFSSIAQSTRNCIAILHDDGQQTEILESGPELSEAEIQQFKQTFSQLTEPVSVITLSGSLPLGTEPDLYIDLIKEANSKDKKVILDTSGTTLQAVLHSPSVPYAIKPNLEELQGLSGKENLQTTQEIKQLLTEHPLFSDIPLIVVSLGADGALAKYLDQFYKVDIPKIEVKNPVGSGDATVAGLALSLAQNQTIQQTLKTAMTLGMLNAMEEMTGCVKKEHFDEFYAKINVLDI